MTQLLFGPGKIIVFSEGEYSDFGYCGHVVTLEALDIKAEIAAYKAQFEAKSKYDRPEPDGFVAWLCAQQKCAEINCTEIWLGRGYGDLIDDPAA